MPAEVHYVILYGVYQGYILISDLLQLSLLSCGVTVVVSQQQDHLPQPILHICLLHDPKVVLFKVQPWPQASFEFHTVSLL